MYARSGEECIMTCEHCKDKPITLADNAGAAIITLTFDFNYCDNTGCARPTIFCGCECHHLVGADVGVQ